MATTTDLSWTPYPGSAGDYMHSTYRGTHVEVYRRQRAWTWSFYDDLSSDPDLAVARSDGRFDYLDDAVADMLDYIDSYIYERDNA